MELLQSPSFLLGLIGWAATAKLIFDAMELSPLQQRAMVVFTWMLWMVPAFDIIVYQGLISSNTALVYGSAVTALPAVLVSIATFRWHSKSR